MPDSGALALADAPLGPVPRKLRFALNPPAAAALNETETVQLALIARDLGQLFVWLKSAAFAPTTAIPLKLRASLPVLVRVTVCAGIADPCVPEKVREVGASVITGATPVPVIEMDWMGNMQTGQVTLTTVI